MMDEAPRTEKAPDGWPAVRIAFTIFALFALGTIVLALLMRGLLG